MVGVPGPSIEPYYDSDGIVIYHGDCREVIPALPAQLFDLLLTDPPYGILNQAGSDGVRKSSRSSGAGEAEGTHDEYCELLVGLRGSRFIPS